MLLAEGANLLRNSPCPEPSGYGLVELLAPWLPALRIILALHV